MLYAGITAARAVARVQVEPAPGVAVEDVRGPVTHVSHIRARNKLPLLVAAMATSSASWWFLGRAGLAENLLMLL